MKRLTIITAAALVALAAGCGSSGASSSAPTDITVRTVAVQRGLGCTQSPIVGKSSLVLKDADGTVVATGATEKTPGTDSCDWTTVLAGVPASDFYSLETQTGDVIGTVQGDVVADGTLDITIDVVGAATIT